MNKQEGAYCIEYLKGGYTWTIYSGCKHQEAGICTIKDCWARRVAHRMESNPKSPYSKFGFEPHFYPERLEEPLKVKKPTIIGVAFMGDLFGERVPADWIERVIDVCQRAEWHRFLFLTKNPVRYRHFVFPPNCWLGTSISGHKDIDRAFELLESAWPNDNAFLSLEPFSIEAEPPSVEVFTHFKWLIIGGLSGENKSGCRISDIDWILKVMKANHKPVFIKSNAFYPGFEKFQQKPKELILL